MKILLIGSGGREHALAWKIAQSPLVTTLYAAPGNPGIGALAGCVPIDVTAIDELAAFAVAEKIDLVVVGPEAPLTLGLADRLRECGIAVFGPSEAAARLEGSKAFMKDTVRECGVKTAAYGRFTDAAAAEQFIRAHGAPIVVKTDGLAAGKGVIIAQSVEEAIAAASDMLSGASFGDAGLEVVIEEFLEGEEISFFALCDGKTAIPFGSAQDHKRAFDGDKGPNTGGMGAYSPARLETPALEDIIMRDMIAPTLAGMAEAGAPFTGVLFAGLMVKDGVPTLLEYNVRFGDPECQTLMRRLESDIVPILDACARGALAQLPAPVWSPNPALTVVMAANGYPGTYEKGSAIKGLEKAAAISPDASVFHAGTARNADGALVATGGRVLNVTATGNTVAQAREAAYAAVDAIDWPGGFCRRDIAWRVLS